MILKKPYAFFIKMFKPIHLFLSALILYLIYLSNNILDFLNKYIYSTESLIDELVLDGLINNYLYIIPLIVIVLFILLLGIMFKKNKPILFYFVGIFLFIAVLVINIYSINFLRVLVENIVSVKTVKLIHDLVFINMMLETVSFILIFIRGIGLDFKKFDFNSDISKMEISENDAEEFEFNVNIDFNERKRRRKEKLRNLKYLYFENRFVANLIIAICVFIVVFFVIYFINKGNYRNKEGIYYNANSFTFKVNETTILNTNHLGNKITDNYLIVVNTSMKSNYSDNSLYLDDFSLKIENTKFKPVKKYFNSLIDLGVFYKEQILPLEYTDYLFVYEIPEKYIQNDMLFSYNSEGNIIEILLNPKKINNTNKVLESKKINEKLKLEGALSGTQLKINNYSLNNKFLIEYNYCIKENDCILSKEYLKASINENYDKVVLKLNVDYDSNSALDINSFYKLLSKFGIISYKKGDTWNNIYKFEEIVSKRISNKNDVYIGVNSDIMGSDSIKFVFNVRGLKYEYILK